MSNITLKVVHEDGINKFTILHATEKSVKYNIYKKMLFDCFGKEANEHYDLIGTVTANDGLLCRFEDADCYKNDKPLVPVILNQYKIARDEYQVTVDSYNVGYRYEYYVTTELNGELDISDKVKVITNTSIKKYKYAVRTIDNKYEYLDLVPNSKDIFYDMSSNKLNIKLKDGYNLIFIKAVNIFDTESDQVNVLCNILKDDPGFPSRETGCGIPVAVRYNNRYRGPQESKKIDFFYMQAKSNLEKLKKRFNDLDIMKDIMLDKPNYTYSDTSQKLEDIKESYDMILEDIKYEQRND